jgi:signal transduction histidine kinase
LILDAASYARPLAARKQIALEVSVAPRAERVRCDRERILQALSSLLDGAIALTPVRGSVTLAEGARGSDVTFIVRFSGEGIPRSRLPRVFALAQRIIAAHHGQITVTSREDSGTAVSFSLALLPERLSAD